MKLRVLSGALSGITDLAEPDAVDFVDEPVGLLLHDAQCVGADVLWIRTARVGDTPAPCRKIITSRMVRCSAQLVVMVVSLPGPMRWTSRSLRGVVSMTVRVSSSNWRTIASASLGPIPRMSPDPR